jgi:hypothetical protein
MRRIGYLALALAIWAAPASPSRAGNVINPIDIQLVEGAATLFPVANLINGSGLDAMPATGSPLPATWNHQWQSPDQNSWVSTDPGGFPADWFAASGTIPRFVIDLGQEFPVEAVHLWPYAGGTGVAGTIQGNSARTLEFRFNTSAEGDAVFAGPPVVVDLNHGPVSETPPGMILPRQDFAVGPVTAQFVEMRITDNWFVAPGDGSGADEHGHLSRGGDRIGLGEVRFSAVPEPTTWAFFAASLAAMLAIKYRRRRS